MDHHEVMRRRVVERYLLDELPPPERDEFEEHYFDCQECAADLKTAAAFLDEARKEFKRRPAPTLKPMAAKNNRFAFFRRPAFLSPVFALLLLVVVYQNVVVYPRFAGEIARSKNPEILAPVSLIGGNSRGGAVPSVTVTNGQPLLISLDIPTAEKYASYSCVLVAPSGAAVWRVPVSAEQAKDTVSIRIPAGNWEQGDYGLIVQGLANRAGGGGVDLAHYRFTLHSSN